MQQTPEEKVIEVQQLSQIRQEIDAVDAKIQDLISQRALCAQKVADIKTRGGQVDTVFYRPEREAQVLRAVKSRNDSLISDNEMARLFREIMSVCLALEHPTKVAYLGPEGSYSHSAAIKQFGSAAHPFAVSTIEEVFESVEKGEVDYGIVPVENSSEGTVKQTQQSLLTTPLLVNGEVDLAIHHCLLSSQTKFENIQKIVAHPQALGQCEKWLANNMPWAVLEPVDSNGLAAKMAMQDTTLGAIASEQAAQVYDLTVLEKHIEDQKDNTTKFWVVGREAADASGEDKTAMVLSITNKAGALLDILACFASRQISMTRIISQPALDKKWDYIFFIDIQGHREDEKVRLALQEVAEQSSYFKLLGSFPLSPLD